MEKIGNTLSIIACILALILWIGGIITHNTELENHAILLLVLNTNLRMLTFLMNKE